MFICQKGIFDDLQTMPHHLGGAGVDAQASLLCLQKDTHHPTRLFTEDTP
jgi:hypothetical protein